MKKANLYLICITLVIWNFFPCYAQENDIQKSDWTPPPKYIIDWRVDNMNYWLTLSKYGIIPVAPETPFMVTTYTGNEIFSSHVMTKKSIDIPVTNTNTEQSENSIFVDPINVDIVINSNNSSEYTSPFYGANCFQSTNSGTNWGGSAMGAGENNSGDPAACIDRNGRYFIGFVNSTYGQTVSYSTNQGTTWNPVLVRVGSGILDKNHLWVDNCLTSPNINNIYDAWTPLGSSVGYAENNIEFSRSTNGGLNWSTAINISAAINAGSHNQGVNITSGPNGEVYAFWAVYDSYPSYEATFGFAKSTNGGSTFSPATRFLTGCKGIRSFSSPYLIKGMRTNSFPSATCDISGGVFNGTIYMVWANQGVPGINTGNDIDIYLVKSTNQGNNWSIPIKVTTDALGSGKMAWFPWISCDPVSGNLSVVFYDDRNCSSTQAETWVANSVDGGVTWDNYKVSDIAFTPSLAGMPVGYMGDYLGITARSGMVYPCWTDNRSGHFMAYVSPYVLGPPTGQPYISYNSYSLDDPLPNGNNNHLMDYNENNTLTIAVKNIGDQTSNNVNIVLRTTCPFITITDSTESYGNIDAGNIVSKTDAFAYTVSNNIPDGTQVIFVLTATDNSDRTYISNFIVEAHAPALSILNYTILDPLPGGNNNGKLDPNESADIIFSVSNPGDWEVTDVSAALTTNNPDVNITIPTVNLNTLISGQTKQATHHVTISSSAPIGSGVDLNYTVSGNSGNYNAQKTFTTKVGLLVEDWETNTFTKFSWIQNTPSTPWTISNINPYEQIFCAKSGVITHNGSTSISITLPDCANDSISFYKKVSSEAGYDFLKFYIDGIMVGNWSGEVAWSKSEFPVTAGAHTFKWEYMKDNTESGGSDCAWLDYIIFPAITPIIIVETPVTNNLKLAAYPNPSKGLTTIVYEVEKTAEVSINIYNTFGQKMSTLLNNQITYAGKHEVIFNNKGLPPGIYFVVYSVGNSLKTLKIILQ